MTLLLARPTTGLTREDRLSGEDGRRTGRSGPRDIAGRGNVAVGGAIPTPAARHRVAPRPRRRGCRAIWRCATGAAHSAVCVCYPTILAIIGGSLDRAASTRVDTHCNPREDAVLDAVTKQHVLDESLR